MEEKIQAKISLPEILIVGMFILSLDIIMFALIWFGLDDFGIIDIIAFPVTQLYLWFKGVRGIFMLIGNVLETIPYNGWWFERTICFAITVVFDRLETRAKNKGGIAGTLVTKGVGWAETRTGKK